MSGQMAALTGVRMGHAVRNLKAGPGVLGAPSDMVLNKTTLNAGVFAVLSGTSSNELKYAA